MGGGRESKSGGLDGLRGVGVGGDVGEMVEDIDGVRVMELWF